MSEGRELDRAVAEALGRLAHENEHGDLWVTDKLGNIIEFSGWSPSTNWQHGGPIIERERIAIEPYPQENWYAQIRMKRFGRKGDYLVGEAGPTPLIAAMRAFVASRTP